MADFQEWGGQDVADVKGQRMRDALIACGPSAIAPTIDTIRRHSAWTKRYLYLPDALRGLGEPAHRALLAAIDSEQDARARAHLTSALQIGFSDFSRFDRWLADASKDKSSSFEAAFFAGDVRSAYSNAPKLEEDDHLSPEFIEWWRTNKQTTP